MPDIAIFVIGLWIGVFWGILIIGLLKKENESDNN